MDWLENYDYKTHYDRFTDKIDNFEAFGEKDECCLWNASVDNRGYGQFSINQRPVKAHRLAYYIWYNEVPKHEVCHAPHSQCGHRNCVTILTVQMRSRQKSLKNRKILSTPPAMET